MILDTEVYGPSLVDLCCHRDCPTVDDMMPKSPVVDVRKREVAVEHRFNNIEQSSIEVQGVLDTTQLQSMPSPSAFYQCGATFYHPSAGALKVKICTKSGYVDRLSP